MRHGIGKGTLKKPFGTSSFEIDTRVQVLSELREHLMKSSNLQFQGSDGIDPGIQLLEMTESIGQDSAHMIDEFFRCSNTSEDAKLRELERRVVDHLVGPVCKTRQEMFE